MELKDSLNVISFGLDDVKNEPSEHDADIVLDEKHQIKVEDDSQEKLHQDIQFVIEEVKGKKTYSCALCDRVFSRSSNLKSHIVIVHGTQKDFKCPECLKGFASKNRLDAHIVTHFDESLPCQLCNKVFKSARHLRSHLQRHTGEKKHKCDICGKNFSDSSHKRRHMKQIHFGQKPEINYQFTCKLCDTKLQSKTSYERHLLVKHSSARNLKCPQCPKTFKIKYALKEHMIVHNDTKAFSCKVCKKEFKRKSHWTNHCKTHNSKPEKCCHCGKMYKTRYILRDHVSLWHRGLPMEITDGPTACTICLETFETLDNLKEHIVIHDKERKIFHCRSCGKDFQHRTTYDRHLTTHQKVKPFECAHCGKQFKRKDSTLKHIRTHSKNRQTYECGVCGAVVKNKKTLQEHDRKHNVRNKITKEKKLHIKEETLEPEDEKDEPDLETYIEVSDTIKIEQNSLDFVKIEKK